MIAPAHLNEHLARFLPVVFPKLSDDPVKLSRMLRTPYLTLTDADFGVLIKPDDITALGLFDQDRGLRTPFPKFRFCCEFAIGYSFCGYAERNESGICLVSWHPENGRTKTETFICEKFDFSSNRSLLRVYDAVTLEDLTKFGSSFQGDVGTSYDGFVKLCYHYLAPHNFSAVVIPSTQGKSVEWRQAREHYVIVHRHHSANNAAHSEGAVVTSEKAREAHRIAHSRRAHTRLLRSEKWKNSRGRRVFVKATWCGPKEWRDTAGQTYRLAPRLSL